MAVSSDVSTGDQATAAQYNELREDVLDAATGHAHTGGADAGKTLDAAAIASGVLAVARIGGVKEMTVAEFQTLTITASGTATNPTNMNDNDVGTDGDLHVVGEYYEVDFDEIRCCNRWRIYGTAVASNDDGAVKLQAYNNITRAWDDIDTISNIVQNNVWSGWSTFTRIASDQYRFVSTIVDTTMGYTRPGEIEIDNQG